MTKSILARAALVAALGLGIVGCASTSALRRGRDAERNRDYDIAVVEYTKALRLHPNDMSTRLALERAKLRAAQEHFNRGRRLAALAKLDEALVEFEMAAEMNPTSAEID